MRRMCAEEAPVREYGLHFFAVEIDFSFIFPISFLFSFAFVIDAV